MNRWKRLLKEIRADVKAARERDPAAQGVSAFEILTSWAGVQALLAHRAAHALMEAGVPLLPRAIAYLTRAVTGIEIHPAAQIGKEFFIDHGSGVVIGETAAIGNCVTLYQGVTLGGTGFQRGKRHPTLGDNVTVGSGAKLLGPIAVGDGAKIGANTVVGQARGQARRRPRRRLDPPARPDRRRDQGALGADRRRRGAAGAARRRQRPLGRGGEDRAPHRPLFGRRLRRPAASVACPGHPSLVRKVL
jgi:serine O-acetyltransferase